MERDGTAWTAFRQRPVPGTYRCDCTFLRRELVALRDSMRKSATQYLQPGEPVKSVIGEKPSSQWLAALTGIFVFLHLNRYRILAVTPSRIVVLDAGQSSMK